MDALDLGTQFIPSDPSSKRSYIASLDYARNKTYPRLPPLMQRAPEQWRRDVTERARERVARELALFEEADPSSTLFVRAPVRNKKPPSTVPKRDKKNKNCIFTMGNVSLSIRV